MKLERVLSKYFKCDCFSHAMEIEIDKEDDRFYFSYWNRYYDEGLTFIEKIKAMWNILIGKRLFIDDVVFDKEKTQEIVSFLQNSLNTSVVEVEEWDCSSTCTDQKCKEIKK